MPAVERVARRSVIRDVIGSGAKGPFIVAGSTVDRLPAKEGGAGMGIVMATTARGGGGPGTLVCGSMAGGTADPTVRACQRISGAAVIESPGAPFTESGGYVAIAALRSQSSGMGVRVAGGALPVRNGRQRGIERTVTRGMTPAAPDRPMLPGQRIQGAVVVEARGRIPLASIVAAGTGCFQPAAMHIGVTAHTGRVETGPVPGRSRRCQRRDGPMAILGGMAGSAFRAAMRALESPACPLMIEAPDAVGGPRDQTEIDPGVIRMAGRALARALAGMESPALPHQPPNIAVAGQAGLVHRIPAANRMTRETAGRALQRLVRAGQPARRQLGRGRRGQEQQGGAQQD
jgi:hypothetical protein